MLEDICLKKNETPQCEVALKNEETVNFGTENLAEN